MPEAPPSPSWEGVDSFTCSMEVELPFVTPDLRRALLDLFQPVMAPDGWIRPPDTTAAYKERAIQRKIDQVKRELGAIETVVRTCHWDGEVECYVMGWEVFWTCPACGTEHRDPNEDPYAPDRHEE